MAVAEWYEELQQRERDVSWLLSQQIKEHRFVQEYKARTRDNYFYIEIEEKWFKVSVTEVDVDVVVGDK